MGLRAEGKFLRRIKLIWPVQSSSQKYSAGPVGQIRGTDPPVLSHRGALANVINEGQDAVDADGAPDESA
jgi:hypothetical protein